MQEPPKEPVKYVETNVYLPYRYIAGDYRARAMHGLKDKTFVGSKCSKTGKVFVTPLVNSPESFAPCTEFVALEGRGVVPQIAVPSTEPGDPALDRALELLRTRRAGTPPK